MLGAFSWTIGLASKFILTTIGALVRMLIPRSWANEGVEIMEWIVAVPNYAGTVTTPTGRTVYGFARDQRAARPVHVDRRRAAAAHAGVRHDAGDARRARARRGADRSRARDRRGAGLLPVLVDGGGGDDRHGHAHGPDAAARSPTGLHQLMLYAVDGVALGGWQLVDLALMALVAIELLSLIFLKVVIILLGALLYATGPITIGLVATESGAAIARAWASAVGMLIALPVVWATLFAVGALLVGDAGTAGPLIAGNSSVGSLLGGVLLAVAGAASLWMCLRAAREAMGLLRMQLGGLLALSHRGSAAAGARDARRSRARSDSLRRFGARVAQAAGGAAGELAAAGAGGAAVVRGGRAVGYVGRHGVLGTAAAGGRAAAGTAAPHAAALVGRSRAGAVAVRMAKAGTAGWHGAARTAQPPVRPRRERAAPASRRRARRGAGPDREPTAPASSRGGAARSRRAARHRASDSRAPDGPPRPRDRPGAASADAPGRREPAHGRAATRRDRPRSPPAAAAQVRTPPPRGGNRPGRGKR